MQENFLLSTSSPAFIICSLLNDGHSDWHEFISHYSLDFYFSNSWKCLASLLVPIICMSSLEKCLLQFSSVQLLSCVWLFATPWTTALLASLSITSSRSLPKAMSIVLVMPSNQLILCHPLLLLPSIFPSIRVFSNESALHTGGQSIGVTASTSVPLMNTQDWSPLGWTGWISLQSKGLSRVFSNTINSLVFSFLYSPTLTSIHDHWKNHSLD